MKLKLRLSPLLLCVACCLSALINSSIAEDQVEKQITSAAHGHILTNTGVWSPDSKWVIYDVRSDAAGDNFDGQRIERVNLDSGEVEVLFESRNEAHCGVATTSPTDDRIVFIHLHKTLHVLGLGSDIFLIDKTEYKERRNPRNEHHRK